MSKKFRDLHCGCRIGSARLADSAVLRFLSAIGLSGTLSRKKEARMSVLNENGFSIHGFKVSESDSNYNYLVACEETGECVVIDPLDPVALLKIIRERDYRVRYVLNTHAECAPRPYFRKQPHNEGFSLLEDTYSQDGP